MSKQRGLSLEQKRQRILHIFHSTAQVYQLKEVEKLGAKAGVTLQSVKEVVQSLLDDSLAHCERIGSCNAYWAFPSDAHHARAQATQALQRQQTELEQRAASLGEQVDAARRSRLGTDERLALLQQLASTKERHQRLLAAYQPMAASDPAVLRQRRMEAEQAGAAAARWADNIDALRDWMLQQGVGPEQLAQMFALP